MRYRRVRLPGASYFFTVVTFDRKPIFADPRAVELLRATVLGVQLRHPFEIEAEVFLPDHLHTLWTLPEGDADFSTRWMLVKSIFTRKYGPLVEEELISGSRHRKRERAIWQRRFWEHLIHDERDFYMHIDYIHINPVKHGLVEAAIDWPHSTFRQFVERGHYTADWGSDKSPPLPDWAGRE